jgi:predicted DNA-binding ribbon-helix-helix protein
MAGRPTDSEIDLVPAEKPADAGYERDFYTWSLEQARLVREGRWDAVDRDNVAEEIESLGREQFNKLTSALRVLMLHMLKWEHQPALRSRSWALSIKAQRAELDDIIADNPGLKPRIGEAISRGYRKASIEAARETGLDEEKFSKTCPYTWDDIIARDFSV